MLYLTPLTLPTCSNAYRVLHYIPRDIRVRPRLNAIDAVDALLHCLLLFSIDFVY